MNQQKPLSTKFASRAYATDYGSYDDKIIDPQQTFRALRRRLPLFIFIVLSTFLAVAIFTFQATPIYATSASVIIDNREKSVVDIGAVMSGLPPDAAVVDTEVEIIKSRSLAEKVVRKLQLNELPEFNPTLRTPGVIDKLRASVQNLIFSYTRGTADAAGETAMNQARINDMVVATFQSKIGVRRMGTTYGIEISARSQDPDLAAEIANAVADQYLVEQLDAKFDATRRANAWLEDRLGELRNEVNEAESAVEAYRAASGLLATGDTTLNEQQIADINGQLIIQRSELAEAEARLNGLREAQSRGLGAEVSGEALQSPVISELRRQQSEINRERADLQTRYGPRHPEFQRIATEEANIQAQIDREIQRIASNLEGEVAIARQRVRSLEQNLGGMRNTLIENNRAMVRLRELERNAEASRALYEAFLTRFKETNEQEGLAEADARILSAASVPEDAAFPKTSLNLVIGLMLGLMLGTVAVIISEAMNNQIRTADDIEDSFNTPFLGNFQKLSGAARKKPADYLVANPMSSYAESYRNLRASIMFADLDAPVQTVAITSSQPDDGKTTIVYGLGRMSAMSGTKTLIVDGDFHRKQLTGTAVEGEREAGVLECLFGEAKVQDAVVVDEKTSLHILPLTSDRYTPRDVFGSKAFDELMRELKDEYELIIFDTGPISLIAETRVLTSKVDQVVVVARWLRTNRSALKQTLSILNEFRANVVGVVLNQVDLKKYHRQGYGHSGYSSYAKYYTS